MQCNVLNVNNLLFFPCDTKETFSKMAETVGVPLRLWNRDVDVNDEILITVLREVEFNCHVTGYHVYKTDWHPFIGEILPAEMEPTNIADKYAVCVKKDGNVVGHLEKGRSGRFAKTIFFFLRADAMGSCSITVTGRAENLGDNKGQNRRYRAS